MAELFPKKKKTTSLTSSVMPGGNALPRAVASNTEDDDIDAALGDETGRRALAMSVKMFGAKPDLTALNDYARQRQGNSTMELMNALAAQRAGDDFKTMQQYHAQQSRSNADPIEYGDYGYIADGAFHENPYKGRKDVADQLFDVGKANAAAYRAEQERIAADRRAAAREAGMDARAAARERALYDRLYNKPFGAGDASQIGSDATGSPVFRDSRTGQLFNYDQKGAPAPYAGPIKPKASTAMPSEDERKAAAWFAQADLAGKNMDEVLRTDPTAAIQPFSEVVTDQIPFIGNSITQSMRSAPRQQFMQAASSMSEALLRAATGAGINQHEAEQKIRETVPQFGDKPEVIAQKRRGYQIYMAALRARAGRAMPALEEALKDAYAGMNGGTDGVVDLPSPGKR